MIYSLQNERFRLSASDMGAELTSFQDVRTSQPYEYIWQDRNVWNGQSPLLFPIVGRLRDDTYVLNGHSYTLRKHGFAKRMRFALETQTEDSFTLLLTDDDATREAFPFAFELRATDEGRELLARIDADIRRCYGPAFENEPPETFDAILVGFRALNSFAAKLER